MASHVNPFQHRERKKNTLKTENFLHKSEQQKYKVPILKNNLIRIKKLMTRYPFSAKKNVVKTPTAKRINSRKKVVLPFQSQWPR
jgi:hypothetical protein